MTHCPKITNELVLDLCVETTKLLKDSQDKLAIIKWTNGESNIDTEYSELACECCRMAWHIMKLKYPEYSKIDIACEIPDINITFIYPDGRNKKHKIELKSSKSTKMSGSTIKKLNINQPLIYCLRPNKETTDEYKIRCSQYHNAMGESNSDLFQDRTPRPGINFEKMKDTDDVLPFEHKEKNDWIDYYAKCALHRVDGTIQCRPSWQDDLVKKIIEKYLKNTSIEEFTKMKEKLIS